MIAQILKIENNAVKEGRGGKNYKGVAVTYQPPPYKGQQKDPTTRFLFDKSDIVKQFKASGLKEGDWAEIKFDDSKWKNPESFTPSSAPNATTGASVRQNVTSNISSDQTQVRIARAVAIKEAMGVMKFMADNNGYTATNLKKHEFVIEELLKTARALEPYLTLTDKVEEVEDDDFEGEDFEQEDFEND